MRIDQGNWYQYTYYTIAVLIFRYTNTWIPWNGYDIKQSAMPRFILFQRYG